MADLIDLTGKKYDNFTVLRKGNGRKTAGGQYKATWICGCVCGKEFEADAEKIRRGSVHSCGCLRYQNRDYLFPDITGKRYGRLVVIRRLQPEERKRPNELWLCKCDCGKIISANAAKLNSGTKRSCGCLKYDDRERIKNLNRKYKYSNRRLYRIYRAMINRCYDERHKAYHRYGSAGIHVCPEWLDEFGFDKFYEWSMDNGYREDLTIDRIDNQKGYSPDNCRWITNLEQQNNKKLNIVAEYNGKSQSLAEWARELNVTYSKVHWRYVNKQMTMEQIVNELKERE